jgi:hypothetical protein
MVDESKRHKDTNYAVKIVGCGCWKINDGGNNFVAG